MKTTNTLAILVLVLGVAFCPAKFTVAAPMSTAFTYQGHLYDNNDVANGIYDFQFKLYDDPNIIIGQQIGSDVNVSDVDVIDGYFTVEMDFGNGVFDGNAVWLEIGVRPEDQNDPNTYAVLIPRQKVSTTPYALYAKSSEPGYSLDAADGYPKDAVYVDNYGYVGIGTTDTGMRKLKIQSSGYTDLSIVSGDMYSSRVFFGDSSNDAKAIIDYSNLYNTLNLRNLNTLIEIYDDDQIRVGSGNTRFKVYGEIGIAELSTEPNASEGYGKMYVKSTTGGIYFKDSSGTEYDLLNQSDNDWIISSNNMYSGISGNVGVGDTSPDGKFEVNPDDTEDNGDEFVVRDDGKVGIGTTAPAQQLEVMGNIQATLSANPTLILKGNDTTNNWIEFHDSGGMRGYVTYNHSGDTLYIGNTASTPWEITLNSDGTVKLPGNVGIGTASPGYKLHVIGDIAYTGGIYDVSDLRLKENITPLRKAVEKISSLQVIYFNNKGEYPDKREVGVIAQDVEKVLPELVSANERGYKSVDYTKLSAVLIEAVKELKSENDLLKKKLESLEKTTQRPQTITTKGAVQ